MIEPRRRLTHWIASCVLGRAICLIILISSTAPIAGDVTARAQSGGSLLNVFTEPAMAKPGQSISLDVVASGAGPYTAIAVDVPSELTIAGEATCVHSLYYCDQSTISTLDASTTRLTVTAPGNNVDVSNNWPTSGYSASVRVTLSFSILVPSDAVPGTRFTIDAYVDGLFNLYDPASETDKHVSIVLEVLDVSGKRVAPPPDPVATSVPTTSAASAPQRLEQLDLAPGAINEDIYLVPGEPVVIDVSQAFPDVLGAFSLTLTLPGNLRIIEGPTCHSVFAESCATIDVLNTADGGSHIKIFGEHVEFDAVRLNVTAETVSTAALGSSSAIVGRYAVTETATGQLHESEFTVPVYIADNATQLTLEEEEGIIRVTFEKAGVLANDTGGCITLADGDRWGYQYFACDNDSAQLPADWDALRWTYVTDQSPTVGEIVVSLSTGTYFINAESFPSGFTPQPGSGQESVTVTTTGAEFAFEAAMS